MNRFDIIFIPNTLKSYLEILAYQKSTEQPQPPRNYQVILGINLTFLISYLQNCCLKYTRQACRATKTQFTEHIKYSRTEKSNGPQQVLESNYSIDIFSKTGKLLQGTGPYESILFYKNSQFLNEHNRLGSLNTNTTIIKFF